jgi:neutral ceramidase
MLAAAALAAALCTALPSWASADYLVGLGKADMTGPIVEVNQMGYAQPSQLATGLHLRLFARAFIVADPAAPEQHVVFVNMDAGMPSMAQKLALTKKLRQRFGGRYTERNVLISGTHTHSGPSGFFQYMLFNLAGSYFVNQTFTAFVDGVFDAIVLADADLRPGDISLAEGDVAGANINRSPSSYLYNPPEERARYAGDTDTALVQLRFDQAGKPGGAGLLNWFAAHPTSMNFTNTLISGDHKGTASQWTEQKVAGAATNGVLPGEEAFVAAFAASNLGDVSPNTAGPLCHGGPAQGRPCDLNASTCPMADGSTSPEYCWSLGPSPENMFESTKIIARKQAAEALRLFADRGAQRNLSGPVGFAHTYVNMSDYSGPFGRTCPAALGYGFAGGTTDGPGDAPFHQDTHLGGAPTKTWNLVRDVLADVLCSTPPTDADYACHHPKPVLLPTGPLFATLVGAAGVPTVGSCGADGYLELF